MGVAYPSGTGPGSPDGAVLVIDDDLASRALAGIILRRAGYPVVEAASAEEALTLLAGPADFALVATDVVMPGMTGSQLISRLRTLRRQPSTQALRRVSASPRTTGGRADRLTQDARAGVVRSAVVLR